MPLTHFPLKGVLGLKFCDPFCARARGARAETQDPHHPEDPLSVYKVATGNPLYKHKGCPLYSELYMGDTKKNIVKGVCWEDLSDMYQKYPKVSKNIQKYTRGGCLHMSAPYLDQKCFIKSFYNPGDTNSKLLVLILQHLTTRNCVPALVPSFSPAFAAFTEASWRSCIGGLWVNASICIIN